MATKLPQKPKNKLELILCDADIYNIGTNDFFWYDKKLYKELFGKDITKDSSENVIKWFKEDVDFLEGLKFKSKFADKLNRGRKRNIELLKEKIEYLEEKSIKKAT